METFKNRYGFIPMGLYLKNLPELSCFPYNIMFGNYTMRNQALVFGHSIYNPDLESLKENEEIKSMNYYNKYNRTWRIEIIYYQKRNSYEGTKYNFDKGILYASGTSWNMFFTHLTMHGPSNGETCIFEEIK
jgi:hypothetical protein